MEKRKRKNKKKVAPNGSTIRLAWYDEWEESESSRRLSAPIDPSLPRVERLHIATHEFKSGRPLHQNQDLQNIWNNFRVFIGLISSIQPPAVRKMNAAMNHAMAQQQEQNDEEEEEEMPNAGLPKERTILVGDEQSPRNAPNPLPPTSMTEEDRQMKREYYREVRNEKSDRFLNDAEQCIRIFLSGYFRDRGLMFSEKFCRDAPILLDFFLKFLIRNRIFPEMEKSIKKAIAITELAKKELPHTFVLSKAIPDGFSQGCKLLYGSMERAHVWSTEVAAEDASESSEPEAKRQKLQEETEVLRAAAGTEEIELVTPDIMEGMEQDMKDLTAKGVDGEEANLDEEPAPAWGDPAANDWGAPEPAESWGVGPTESPFSKYLGPTALPLTHTTGVIEQSTRRIKSVTMPSPKATQHKKKKSGKAGESASLHDPEAVERELDATFAKMTLVPWPDWDTYEKADIVKPKLLPDSRGAAVTDDCEGAEVTAGPGPTHNPFKDEITVYVEPSTADKLIVGMGICATWVQLARVDPTVPIELDPRLFNNLWPYGIEKEPGGPGVPVALTNIWYMEGILAVHPSFFKDMIPLPTTADVFGEEPA
ncbi:hypothetical protein K466DRAFT_479718 [Polyporus arcularius HHB13444]|uniref:Uncharacterized protein n=1 Tax=Polyporus arcularius HHB13444 TaxID=1314778 RepID=A0A5C3PTA8_9APHY|nr:hypothetical protein K466DRAFT_479718 [Polyporus arcularius HHB13444]